MYCDMHTGIHNHVYMLLTFKIIEQKLVNVLQFIGFNLHTVSLTPLKRGSNTYGTTVYKKVNATSRREAKWWLRTLGGRDRQIPVSLRLA